MPLNDPIFLSAESNPLVESLYTTEKLIEKARGGERLAAVDRRTCLAYLDFTKAHLTCGALADMFQVSETQIRKDKKIIEKEKAKEVFEEDVSLAVFKVVQVIDREMTALQVSKAKCKKGSRDYVAHTKAAVEFALAKLKTLVDMGFVVRELPGGGAQRFDYAALVRKGGNDIDTRPVEMFDDQDKVKLNLPAPEEKKPIPTQERGIVFVPLKPSEVTVDAETPTE